MTAEKSACAGCCDDAECPCVKVCEEHYCDRHLGEEELVWREYFGLRPGMTKAQRLAQLEAFRPLSRYETEDA